MTDRVLDRGISLAKETHYVKFSPFFVFCYDCFNATFPIFSFQYRCLKNQYDMFNETDTVITKLIKSQAKFLQKFIYLRDHFF